ISSYACPYFIVLNCLHIIFPFFLFDAPSTSYIYPLSLHDALPIFGGGCSGQAGAIRHGLSRALLQYNPEPRPTLKKAGFLTRDRSEEHTSELQSRFDIVCRLLLEKKK